LTDCSAALEAYTLEEILNLNDMTEEDVLIYLVEERIITLPEIKPLEYE
jgi:hypothetical protein